MSATYSQKALSTLVTTVMTTVMTLRGSLRPLSTSEVDSIENVESRGIGIGIGIGALITSTVYLIVLLVLYRFKILALNRKLRNEKDRTLTKPETKYQTEHNHAYDEVTDIEASGIQQAQGNGNVNESIHAYDAINLEDVGKQNSNYCTIET
ncbi:uncharacterized protein LOC131949202 [Physella acuta]|uniref:uncharacterized protein LOC131949202 n=1 Tax=Physella acuta TaxID=109671 RepID=UPI0027DE5F81|nr:uncharacterized protein LOC131949202 [Physella acuta]